MITFIRRNKKAVLLTSLIVLNFCLAAWGDDAATGAAVGDRKNSIEIKDFAFDPPVLTVKSGEKVTWINRDDEPHTVVSVGKQFQKSSALDTGDPATVDEAAANYRRALEVDPYLTPALINLANIHYSRSELVEAQALYERSIGLESDFFEAHFNLGNIYHDLGQFREALGCYRESLRLNPEYANAHFYLAVTFEKMGRSDEARPHWRAYQELAPDGEWVELAREFSE